MSKLNRKHTSLTYVLVYNYLVKVYLGLLQRRAATITPVLPAPNPPPSTCKHAEAQSEKCPHALHPPWIASSACMADKPLGTHLPLRHH